MTPKGDAKFKEKMTCGLKNELRNLVYFHASSRKSGNLHFDGLLLSKAYKDLDKKITEELCFMKLKSDVKFIPTTLGSRNGMRKVVNFNASSGKSKNLHFDVLLLSIAYKVPAKKVQKNYLS